MTPSPLHETGTSPHGGTSAPELFNYSEDEDDEWMPFRRSAPDLGHFIGKHNDSQPPQGEDCFEAAYCLKKEIHSPCFAYRPTVLLLRDDASAVFSLGCGDGRFIIECCRLTSCSGVGVELDSSLFARAKRNASRVEGIRASFIQCDFIASTLDLSEATLPLSPAGGSAAAAAKTLPPCADLYCPAVYRIYMLGAAFGVRLNS
ncbi:Histone methylation DOT1 family protein (Precursor), related, related [Eimeria maxima]|uniref:Histone methylation DOT1 family protein (Precursor), related, related n=1 Tax=Eimeria maxima TaxID=5804 RepID=U6MBJ4_EIMMA|nr:Histone methylation DOT1 family protein (Precursor), related, related [Eimeria maxima]CDJ59854.1 Histone methylation DOT1 family protein (Precursor), related, related [Eimeria maxima]